MKDFFYAIADFFVEYGFAPYDALRSMELENWWSANMFSWLFILIGMAAFTYWMMQLNQYDKNNEEDKSISSHSFL